MTKQATRRRASDSALFAFGIFWTFAVCSAYGYALGYWSQSPNAQDTDFFLLSGLACAFGAPGLLLTTFLSRTGTSRAQCGRANR